MIFLLGFLVVIGSILGGYMPHGDIRALNQPLEVLIIFCAAVGAYIIANPKQVLFGTLKHLSRVLRGPPHIKAAYLELLGAHVHRVPDRQIQGHADA